MGTHLYINKEVLSHFSAYDLYNEYQALLTRLYQQVDSYPIELHKLLFSSTEILVFLVEGQKMVATAQGSLSQVIPDRLMVVSNVVTHEDYERQGHGKRVLQFLEAEARQRWGRSGRSLKAVLTNRPERGNSGFYERQGWYPLTPETTGSTEFTRLWEKLLS